MNDDAATLLKELGEAYIRAGYPERQGWNVTPQDQKGASAFRVLSAQGYVEPLAGGWGLTSAGLRNILTSHAMTEEAKVRLQAIGQAYVKAGYPEREAWYYERRDSESISTYQELASRGFIELLGTGYKMWLLTDAGVRSIL